MGRLTITSPAFGAKTKDKPTDEFYCKFCEDKGFVRYGKNEVAPCPKCNPDGAPFGECECDNF